MKRTASLLLATLAVTGLAACGVKEPCARFGPPSAADKAAAAAGSDVEREVEAGGMEYECIVVGDRWVESTD